MTKTDFGYCDVLIGLQYGDEGKAKIVDYLAPRYDVVARFNGGVNAGHTIVTDRGKLALRQVPSAVAYEGQLMYIGSGCALSVADLQKELQSIADIGYSISGRLFISPNSSLVLPHHIVLDKLHGAHVGTTGNGIGPAYADRAFRMRDGMITNIRARDLKADPTGVIRAAEKLLNQLEVEDSYREIGHQALERFRAAVEQVCGFVLESPTFLAEKVASGAKVIFEGAQSYMLDVVAGDVPYVTSSHTSVAAAYSGGDVPPKFHRYAFGVAKLIMSRVGNGPFPSEFGGERSREYCTKDEGLAHTRDYEAKNFDPEKMIRSDDEFEVGRGFRMFSGEYGTGSGRPRRIGYLDLQQLRSAIAANGIDFLFLTKADCLLDYQKTQKKTMPVLKVVGGATEVALLRAPTTELKSASSFEKLPDEMKQLIGLIEEQTAATVLGVGVGPHRNALLVRDGILR